MRDNLLKKMKGLVDFIKTSILIIKSSNNSWKPYYLYDIPDNLYLDELEKLNYDLSTIFKLWMNDNFKENILNMLKIIYTLDAINTITKFKKNRYWSLPNYSNETKILDIRNPILNNQQPNPVYYSFISLEEYTQYRAAKTYVIAYNKQQYCDLSNNTCYDFPFP